MSCQKNLNRNTLKVLAGSENASSIKFLNLMFTKASYNGIVALWDSPTFGRLVNGSPVYERHTGTPVSIIEIEIGHTVAYEQYTQGLFKYPLPLRQDFEITYGHRGVGETWTMTGYKQIKLLDHGEELASNRTK